MSDAVEPVGTVIQDPRGGPFLTVEFAYPGVCVAGQKLYAAPKAERNLRDFFAAHAMHGLIGPGFLASESAAQMAYRMADAMLKAREE